MLEMGGGGGYGPAYDREPEAVRDDVLDGVVSTEAARKDYGVVIDPASKTIDEEATAATRQVLQKAVPAQRPLR
jgi:N-methylhydantoinase B